jgi:hypothetical protein
MTPLQRAVLAYVEATNEPCAAADIAEAFGCTYDLALSSLRQLEYSGRLIRAARWVTPKYRAKRSSNTLKGLSEAEAVRRGRAAIAEIARGHVNGEAVDDDERDVESKQTRREPLTRGSGRWETVATRRSPAARALTDRRAALQHPTTNEGAHE